jgi:sortase B
MRTKTKIKKTTAFILLLLSLSTMSYAGVKLIQTQQIYQESNTVYEYLSGRVRGNTAGSLTSQKITTKALNSTDTADISDDREKTSIYIPNLEIDFKELKSINEEAVAWLYSPDTVIDYPVMKADDYSYYLYHLADRTRNSNGSIFIDYNCPPDFSGELTVLYGHHMKSGSMFGSLEKYKNQKYYQEHPYMYLYTEDENYRIDLIYGFVIGAGQWRNRAFMYEVNIKDLLAHAKSNTTFKSEAEYQEGDRIIAMSTCSYDFEDARYVVVGILREN